MIDIHTHILPGIDDGARNENISLKMLHAELKAGVQQIFLTPHFNCETTSIDAFIENRQSAFERLSDAVGSEPMPELRLGAEVRYSPALLNLPFEEIALNNNYLLLELPFHHYPAHIKQVIMNLDANGITPILAHVERYQFFRDDPELLYSLIQLGAMGQVNVSSLEDKKDRGFAKACLNNSLAHFVASDTHNMTDRAPCMDMVPHILSESMIELLEKYSDALWEDETPYYFDAHEIKKTIFGYK